MSEKQIHIETFCQLVKPTKWDQMPHENIWQVKEYDRAGNLIYSYYHRDDVAEITRQKFSKSGRLIKTEVYDLLHPDQPPLVIRSGKENVEEVDEDSNHSDEGEIMDEPHSEIKTEYYKEKYKGRVLYVSKHSFLMPDGTEVESSTIKRNRKGQTICKILRRSNATTEPNPFVKEDDGTVRLNNHSYYVSQELFYEDWDEEGEWHIYKHRATIEPVDGETTVTFFSVSRRDIEYYEDEPAE